MRILGIDYGGTRIGLATSDALGMMAHGLPTLRNTSDADVLKAIQAIIEEREVKEIVIGLPRNMNDTLGPQAEKTMQFGDKLKTAFGLPVHYVDERLTSERAKRLMVEAGYSFSKQRKNVDRIAAQFILQAYLDGQKRAKTETEGG